MMPLPQTAENICVFFFWFSLLWIIYSFLLYPALLSVLSRQWGRPPLSSPGHTPSIGVVIPVYNEEKVIADKLRNLFSSDYPGDRLSAWVGSDCSTDRTDEIVSASGDSRVHLWRSAARKGKTGVLNELVPMVDADIVLFTDADIVLDTASIRNLARNFADPEVGGVGGVTLQRLRGQEIRNEETAYRLYEANLKKLESGLHSTISAFGSFYAIRKALFVPFHQHTYSNDDVLLPMNVVRQGYRMCFEPASVSWEEAMTKIKVEFRRRVRIGAGNFQAFFWLLDFLNPKYGWPWFCYVSHKVSRWFSPLFIASAAVTCGLLAFGSAAILYKILFAAGALFIVSGLLYRIVPLKFLRKIFYFQAMNAALALGFVRFLGGIRSAVWRRTERQE